MTTPQESYPCDISRSKCSISVVLWTFPQHTAQAYSQPIWQTHNPQQTVVDPDGMFLALSSVELRMLSARFCQPARQAKLEREVGGWLRAKIKQIEEERTEPATV